MNMTQCKKGDKLILRNGDTAVYIGKSMNTTYTHNIIHNWTLSSVTEEGLQMEGTTRPRDVINFATEAEEVTRTDPMNKILETIKANVMDGYVITIEDLLEKVPIKVIKSYLSKQGSNRKDSFLHSFNFLMRTFANMEVVSSPILPNNESKFIQVSEKTKINHVFTKSSLIKFTNKMEQLYEIAVLNNVIMGWSTINDLIKYYQQFLSSSYINETLKNNKTEIQEISND